MLGQIFVSTADNLIGLRLKEETVYLILWVKFELAITYGFLVTNGFHKHYLAADVGLLEFLKDVLAAGKSGICGIKYAVH